MTSGIFGQAAIEEISKGERQRTDLGDLSPLIRSIKSRGLIHPIVITREYQLVAGERRLESCRQLGWTNIPIQFVDELSADELELIELDENVKRKDLTWEEEHNVYIRKIAIYKKQDPSISQEKLGDMLGLDQTSVSKHLTYEEEKHHPIVQRAVENGKSFSAGARAAVKVRELRTADQSLMYIYEPFINVHQPIISEDFHEWSATYSGPKFNLIHCDFPYGLNEHITPRSGSVQPVAFSDTPEDYWRLFKTLSVNLDNFCAESAHIFFWFAPKFYCQTWEMLKLLDGFQFDEHPLIWHKNKGDTPDKDRRPRRMYEMAFFGWRNGRKILRIKENIFSAPLERERHPHEKSELAIRHFFEMCVDSNTRLFDPTCGSGSALRAARALGAETVFGLELNEEYAEVARRALS